MPLKTTPAKPTEPRHRDRTATRANRPPETRDPGPQHRPRQQPAPRTEQHDRQVPASRPGL